MTKPIALAAIVLAFAASIARAEQVARPADQPRSVTMSLAEYNRLLDLAARAPLPPTTAPVAAIVSSVDLRITVDRESVRGVFNLSGQVLNNGVTRVPIVNGAGLFDATSGGRPVPLVADGQTLNALIAGPGPFAIAAEWGGPLVFRPGRASFVLPVPQAGAARATIDLPGDQADVRLSAGLVTRRFAANGRTLIEATLDPGAATEVWWSLRDSAPAAAAKDLRALADILTLITIDDSDVRMAVLIDVSVTQGELRSMTVRLPPGYEFQSASGTTLQDSDPVERDIILTVSNPSARSHQFLLNLERAHTGGSFTLETGVVSIKDIQRERGEIAIEGVGTMDLKTADSPGLHRIDVRELNPSLHALTRLPILTAFRYQRPAGSTAPTLAVEISRFADASVLAAIADRAAATTLITSEGRALTEVRLEMRNRSQPFLKIELPPGASIVSVDLAGHSAKPANGPDGTRIPLMRAGLRSASPYSVSFVYVHAGTPFLKKGDISMSLPKMDVPIGVVQWEVFVPEQYRARAIDGNMVEARRFQSTRRSRSGYQPMADIPPPPRPARILSPAGTLPFQIRGRVVDGGGEVLPGVSVQLIIGSYRTTAVSDAQGGVSFSGVPQGEALIISELPGFRTSSITFRYDGSPRRVEIDMNVAAVHETVTVTAESAVIDSAAPQMAPPSQNVVNLQQRAAGVLPIRVDVPRAGVSHEFIKPLVVGDQATVTLRYKRR